MSARIILTPFAEKGDKYNIPDTDIDANVSIEKGFTPIYSTPMSKGGKPPTREDFNGIFNLIFDHLYDRQTGLIPLYNNKLNYQKNCSIITNDGRSYLCIKENGPNTEVGIKNPLTSPDYWSSQSGNDLTSLYKDLVSLQGTVRNHLKDTDNPHNVTKEQIGLGNIPNKVSNTIDKDDPNTLATSKAVHDLNEAIMKHLLGESYTPGMTIPSFEEYFKIIKALEGHTFSVSEEGKLLFDGKAICDCEYNPPKPTEEIQSSFTNISPDNPMFDQVLSNMNLKNGAFLTLSNEVSNPNLSNMGTKSTGFVKGEIGSEEFINNVKNADLMNGALFTSSDETLLDMNDNNTYVNFVEGNINDPNFNENINNLKLANGAIFTVLNTQTN